MMEEFKPQVENAEKQNGLVASFSGQRRIRLVWTCSDYKQHQHRWEWSAWVCGRVQRWWKLRA